MKYTRRLIQSIKR